MTNGRTYLVTWTERFTDNTATETVANNYNLLYDYLLDDTIIINEIRVSDDDFTTNRIDDYIIKM